jgi:YD repeat-containing protein
LHYNFFEPQSSIPEPVRGEKKMKIVWRNLQEYTKLFPKSYDRSKCAKTDFYAIKRLIAFVLMLVLTIQMTLIIGNRRVSAETNAPILPNIQQATTISAAPPQVFHFSDSTSLFANSLAFEVSNSQIFNYFKSESLPEGFEAAKVPAFGEKAFALISSPIQSFFGLFSSPAANVTALLSQPVGSVKFDFDGDGKADAARWNPSTTEWKVKNSSNNSFTTVNIGSSTSIITPGNFDGDTKTDAAVFSSGTWTIKQSSNGQTQTISFGQAGDKPVAGDYDGDGKTDAAVFRASNSTWYIRQSSNSQTISSVFGTTGDIAVAGNYDGDTKTDIAVFRPSTGYWHVLGSASGYFGLNWGLASDVPVPADYDGDGKTDFSVYRGSTGTWYVYKSSTNNGAYLTQTWGNYGDQPVPADYDNDNKADFAIWRPTTGVWHIVKSSDASYQYQTLGAAGDKAVTSAYLKQIGGLVQSYDLAKARLSPKNATGGTDLYSRNFGWSSGLVGLSGRAGMGAGFGVSYNSLVWTKQTDSSNNASVYFDADSSNISPGFRFGFPTIEPVYWDKTASKFSYLMVTPSGARVEFKQIGASDTYQTTDSSYAQIKTIGAVNPNDPVENLTIKLSGTDGSVMTYLWKAGAFRCAEIKDRNGNFVTINHDDQGLLRTVTDTLGRIITVNYDSELYPTTITQTWKNNNGQGANVTYTWATFSYTTKTINTNFAAGINVVGPPNGTSLKVLQKITYPGGGATDFTYNDYGQVWKIRNIAADSASHILNQVRTNLETPTANQTDCPRFSETRNRTENFNNGNETVVTNTIQTGQTYNVGGQSGTATKIEVAMANHPHGAVSKTFVGSSGWMESLPIATEDWAYGVSGIERKRWTWTNWTQDDTNLTETLNPRTTESKVGDATNTKRTTMLYYTVPLTNEAVYGLVKETAVYDTNQTTILKKAVTEYNLDNAYVSRRVIGLPSKTEVYGLETNGLNLVSKMTYAYDEENFAQESNQIITPIQHDTANFGATFISGRANQTSTTRWNTEFPTSASEAVTSKIRYDIAGSPVAALDPLNRKVKTNYADSFNDTTVSRNTYAYPTTLTDPANNSSTVKYRFDTGANVRAKSPAPAGNTNGKETTREYDSIGRLSKETVLNNGAYTRYEYPPNQIQSKVYSTIIDTNNNGADQADEVMSEAWTDGAGRTLRARTEHPGSMGGYSGTLAEYDILGQLKRSTVPTEINSNYEPAGDDAIRGWLWTSAEYDWKGRVTREINTDGTDRLMNYDGCGCAGGQVTTVRSENLAEGRRTLKTYQDTLGRTYKTEKLNWDASIYASTITELNGLDRALQVREYEGSNTTPNANFQLTNYTYDGHGRLKTEHLPQQQANKNTTYEYYADDRILSKTDGRGVKTNYLYNSVGLLTNINYETPADPNIVVSANVGFEYDALGNRVWMTDGLGRLDYVYDELSRLTTETRQFTPGQSPNSFQLSYNYNLSGGLKSLSDQSGTSVLYTHDKIARVTEVAANSNGNVISIANNAQYRAWGEMKHLEYGNGQQMNMSFNNRLQAQSFNLSKNGQAAIQKQYDYHADGSLRYAQDLLDPKFDKMNTYDHVGRLKDARSGAEARGQTETNMQNLPYRQTYNYAAFGNTVNKSNLSWGELYNAGDPSSEYDADGRTTRTSLENVGEWWTGTTQVNVSSHTDTQYNSAGQIATIKMFKTVNKEQQLPPIPPTTETYEYNRTNEIYDGDGRLGSVGGWWLFEEDVRGETRREQMPKPSERYMRSTVLGGEISPTTYIYVGKTQIATIGNGTTWLHKDPSGMTVQTRGSSGDIPNPQNLSNYKKELDPTNSDVGLDYTVNLPTPAPASDPLPRGGFGFDVNPEDASYPDGRKIQCVVDGNYTPCGNAWNLLMRGGASIDEQNSRFIAGAIAAEFNLVRVEKQYSVYHQGTKGGFRVIDEATGKVSDDNTGTITKQSWTEQRTEAAWEFTSAMNPFDASVSGDDIPPVKIPRLTTTELVVEMAENVLTDANDLCTQALKKANLLKRALSKLSKVNIVSVSQNSSKLASSFVSDAKRRETLGNYFKRFAGNNVITNFARSGPKAILAFEGAGAFITDGIGNEEVPIGFFIHELLHHAGAGGDKRLAQRLNLALPKNASETDASDKLSDYFNNGCPLSMVNPPTSRINRTRRKK